MINNSIKNNLHNSEELANSITHGIGFLLSGIGLVILLVQSTGQQSMWLTVSSLIYGTSMLVLYGASTLYHSIHIPKLKSFLQRVDHAAIYLLIAGTYTPFTLVLLREVDWWGWSLFIVIWVLAIAGMIIKIFFMGRLKRASLVSYVVMGWLAIIAIKPLYASLSLSGMYWLMAGGALYSLGVIFYKWEKLPYSHAIWHLFVMGGSICHFCCVMLFIYP